MRPLPTAPWRAAAGLAVLTLAVVGLAACGSKSSYGAKPAAASATTAPSTSAHAMTTMAGMPPSSAAAAPVGPAVAADQVSITNFAFAPAAITVKVGTTVTWTNNDEEPHTVFSGAGGIKSPVLASHQNTFSFTFSKPGTFDYNCTIHPFMHGTVTVTA
jgi:amicyanin